MVVMRLGCHLCVGGTFSIDDGNATSHRIAGAPFWRRSPRRLSSSVASLAHFLRNGGWSRPPRPHHFDEMMPTHATSRDWSIFGQCNRFQLRLSPNTELTES